MTLWQLLHSIPHPLFLHSEIGENFQRIHAAISKIIILYRRISDFTGLVPDHLNKESVPIKQVVTFLPVEVLAFNLLKKKKATTMKHNKAKLNKVKQ